VRITWPRESLPLERVAEVKLAEVIGQFFNRQILKHGIGLYGGSVFMYSPTDLVISGIVVGSSVSIQHVPSLLGIITELPQMPELLSAAASAAALKKLLDGLVSGASDKVKEQLKKIQNDVDRKKIYKAISSVAKVKTMWSMDKEVKLLPIYYPSKVIVNDTFKEVSRVNDIDAYNNLVIRGTVGQGKSVFLRYLCIQELTFAERVPVFAELRRFDRTKNFRKFLEERLADMGLDSNNDAFEYFAKSGKLLLLLDGFDELHPDSIAGVISDVESLVQQYPDLRIVVSTRPDGGIDASPLFRVYSLAPLTSHDHAPFLLKFTQNQTQVAEIIDAIKKSSVGIQTLLSTPLLLTLLMIVYKATQEIPPSLSAFYDELFRTLAIRHDSNKAGFRRFRATKLSDSELRRLFEAFCYGARQKDLLVINHSTLEVLLTVASKLTGFAVSADDFAKDITKVTCLMQKEGFQYEFIHKTVVEFHAAYFIQRLTEDVAQKFYSALLNNKWPKWKQELVFLAELDRYRYLKYFFIPSMKLGMSYAGVDADNPPDEIASGEEVLDSVFRGFTVNAVSYPVDSKQPNKFGAQIQWSSSAMTFATEGFLHKCLSQLMEPVQEAFNGDPEYAATVTNRTVREICVRNNLTGKFLKVMDGNIKELLSKYRESVIEINRNEAVTDFINP